MKLPRRVPRRKNLLLFGAPVHLDVGPLGILPAPKAVKRGTRRNVRVVEEAVPLGLTNLA